MGKKVKPNYQALSVADLRKAAGDGKAALRGLRFDKAVGKLSKPAELRSVRREVARVLTELTRKQAGVNVQEGGSK